MPPDHARGVRLDGQRLKVLRKQQPWTQTELAAEADVSERTVRAAEAGKPISIDTANLIATAFHIETSTLIQQDTPQMRGAKANQSPLARQTMALKIGHDYDENNAELVSHLVNALNLLLHNPHILVEGITKGCILVYVSLSKSSAKQLADLYKNGELKQQLEQLAGVNLLELVEEVAPKTHRQLRARRVAKTAISANGAALIANISTRLGLPPLPRRRELIQRFTNLAGALSLGQLPTPQPVMRGDVSDIHIIATAYATLEQALAEEDPLVLRRMLDSGELNNYLYEYALKQAESQGLAEISAKELADAVTLMLLEDKQSMADLLDA